MLKNDRLMKFHLKGLTPLLMHADNVEEATVLDEWRKSAANKNVSVPGDDRSPPWTWQTYLYVDETGNVTMPADNVMVALRQAGAKVTMKRQTTFKALTQSGLFMMEDHLFFTNNKKPVSALEFSKMKDEPFKEHKAAALNAGFDLLIKRANIGTKKHVRVRPMFRAWEVRGTVRIDAPEITNDKLQEIFSIAGEVGLCDWRPGCKTPGRFGMFEASVSKA